MGSSPLTSVSGHTTPLELTDSSAAAFATSTGSGALGTVVVT